MTKAMKEMTQSDVQQWLWKAAREGDCEKIRILAVHGVDIDARNEDGFTAFNIATEHGHADAAMTILAAREMNYARSIGEDPAAFYGLDGAPETGLLKGRASKEGGLFRRRKKSRVA